MAESVVHGLALNNPTLHYVPLVSDTRTTMLHQDAFERIVEQAHKLYTLPSVAADVVTLTSGEDVDAGKIRACIENDPALVVRILRIVNSSMFGLSQPVRDLGQALTLLGVKPLKLLVLGFSLPDRLFKDLAPATLQHYWATALTKAVAAREISETVWKRPGDEAFLGGLLHDLGLLVLIQQVGNPVTDFVARSVEERAELTSLERELLGFDHVQLTSRLLTQWNLPAPLIEAIALSELPPEIETLDPPDRTLPYILHLAGLVTRMLVDEDPTALAELQATGERLHHSLTQDEQEDLVARIEENVGQLSEVLALDLPTGLNYREIVSRAHYQMARAATEVTTDLLQLRAGRFDSLKAMDEMQTMAQAVNSLALNPSSPVRSKQSKGPGHLASSPSMHSTTKTQQTVTLTGVKQTTTEDVRLNAHLTAAVAACRQARCPLSLLLIDLDNYELLHFHLGANGQQKLFERLQELCEMVDRPGSRSLVARDARLALIVPNCDRQQAARLGKELIQEVQAWSVDSAAEDEIPAATISVGAASVSCVSKNFPFRDLLESADRCVYAAHHSGGNGVKSIEVY